MKRIGVLGGSFDPVHYGHLLLAETCREACRLDQVLFVPAAVAPHKQSGSNAADSDRIEMLRLAIGGHEPFDVCTIEVDRGGVSYTVDTLRELQARDADAELFFLLGADSLGDLPTWREPAQICEIATLAVVARAGSPPPDLEALKALLPGAGGRPVRAQLVSMPLFQLSSTEIRERASQGLSIRFRTPRAVETYIEAHRIYRHAAAR